MQSLEPVINYLVDVPIAIGTLSPWVKDPNSGLKQVITEFLNAVMLFEAYLQSGALPYERSPQRKAHRNGTRSRTLKTRVGELTLDKPQFREFPFESSVFERYCSCRASSANDDRRILYPGRFNPKNGGIGQKLRFEQVIFI